jgi:hypothetical protein
MTRETNAGAIEAFMGEAIPSRGLIKRRLG